MLSKNDTSSDQRWRYTPHFRLLDHLRQFDCSSLSTHDWMHDEAISITILLIFVLKYVNRTLKMEIIQNDQMVATLHNLSLSNLKTFPAYSPVRCTRIRETSTVVMAKARAHLGNGCGKLKATFLSGSAQKGSKDFHLDDPDVDLSKNVRNVT